MTADLADMLARLSLEVDDVDPAALAVVRADVEKETMTDAPCTCDLAERLRAAIAERPPPATCVVHDPEAALNAAGVDEARARAEVVRSVVDEKPTPDQEDPLLASLEAKLGLVPATPPKSSATAVLPLNASAQDWARHIGLPSTPDGDNAA